MFKNFGWYVFWVMGYVLLLGTVWNWVLWAIVLAIADTETRIDAFQRLQVAFGWLSSYMLIGVAGGYHQKKQ